MSTTILNAPTTQPPAALFLPDGTAHQIPVPATEVPATNQGASLEPKLPRNKVPLKPTSKKYVLLSDTLKSWGKVPRQQADLADIIARSFEVGVPTPESDILEAVEMLSKQYPSLANSVQHPHYLFKYYLGLKDSGKHAGFIARDFMEVAR